MRERRPLLGLLAALVCCVALGVVGLGVEGRLAPLSLKVDGTASSRGEALARRNFGDSWPFVVLLRGPDVALDRQGPRLVAALRGQPEATVISPWDRGALGELRPGPGRALVLVDYHVPLKDAVDEALPTLKETLRARVHAPLAATQSGFASVSRALQEESVKATERAELLAAPLLVLVLLLVFRSVVAAAVPLAFGALTVFAGRGVLALLSSVMSVDALSLVVCTMMGLALGVDYSLLIVSRFREELAAGAEPGEAARLTRATAGRTTLVAGSTLVAAIFASCFFQPGPLLLSLASTVGVVALISVVIATAALPPLLGVLGERINAGRIGRRRPGGTDRSWVGAAATAALRRPGLAACLVAAPLALLAAPALGFSTGAPGIDELPRSSEARRSAEAIDRAAGPGWVAPFVIVAEAGEGPVTTPRRLALLARWQRRIAAQPGVRTVIGPVPIARRTAPLAKLGERLAAPGGAGPSQLTRLGPRLRQAAGGVAKLRGGLARATAATGLLGNGAERAWAGAGLLAEALASAAAGGERASGAVDRLAHGARRLADGQREAAVGSLTLSLGLRSLAPSLRGNGVERARRLAEQLEAEAEANPALGARARQARTLARVLVSLQGEAARLRGLAERVNDALSRLASGGKRLEGGVGKLRAAAVALTAGLGRLEAGSRRLAGALGQLRGGVGELERGLADGFHRSYPLQKGLRRAAVRAAAVAAPIARGARALRRDSPHLFDSGYFVLSALDGAPPAQRALAGEAVDVRRGGAAARMLIIPDYPLNTAGSRRVGEQLQADAERLGREGGFRAGLAGGAATLNDYGAATKARLPAMVASVVLVTLLMLILLLRTPLLALIAVGLNVASVGAALGVMALVCRIPAGYPLGGHPYVDTIGAAAIFGITFGLSIDYAVFLIARMQERYARDGDNRAAIAFGLERTAAVVTGAAAIMAAVFAAFTTAPIATASQMGVGLTVAILLDATVVRIVLLPAVMRLLGDRVWHVPRLLDRA